MFKRLITRVSRMIDLKVALRAATNVAKDRAPQIAEIAREEATTALKRILFKYFIVMNLVFGAVGFVFGCLVTIGFVKL